ncbi:unnamed protein product (macronuclear) [Paramecium tetraurelia]|uniref:Transmembrane protein n=1 Tax=Paramecium tetraurelia TaxID=5888 RepID=A0CRW3_PARTE|nr:uncharacterized protein GSPATT00009845001 [Paramecium tetraurelia]CAK73530.1 unnamed protein product [Paramecium tetraurelia]|eukprot:XP_001440927.1 hypothetical protein (macronuclear) [Paramecium tetraurelia strain d4-2]
MEEINTQKQDDSPAPSGSFIVNVEKIQRDSVTEDKIQPEEDFELQALFNKLNSTIDEAPFHETKCQKQKQDLSYKAEFIMTHFIKFYIYQLMFYIFGPFVYLFLLNKPALMFNLGFWSFRQDVVFQYIQWVGHIFCLLMYFYFKSLSSLEIGLLWFSLLTRSIIVAAKFSTLNEERVELYESTRLSKQIIYFDVVLFDWAIQSKKIKNLEIAKAAKRHDFDTQFFCFNFLVEPLKETQYALLDDKETQLNLPHEGAYGGINLISYFIDSYQSLNTRKNQLTVALLISFIVVITPKVLAYERYLQNPVEIFLNIVCGVFQILQFNCIFLYLLISLEDMKRKIFLLDQVYYLISTKRVRCNEFKLTPTIDINCPRTIEAWSMLRSIAFDYGASYHIRNQIYHTILILCCVASIIFSFQIILDYFQLDYYYLITLGIIFLIFLFFISLYLLSAAKINQFFEDFKTQIENLKFICQDVKRMRKQYFEENNSEPQNFVHKSFVNHLKAQHDNDNLIIYQRIDNLIDSLDNAQRHIEYDSRNYPLKLYGIRITYEILQNLVVGLFTLISFVVQQRFSS